MNTELHKDAEFCPGCKRALLPGKAMPDPLKEFDGPVCGLKSCLDRRLKARRIYVPKDVRLVDKRADGTTALDRGLALRCERGFVGRVTRTALPRRHRRYVRDVNAVVLRTDKATRIVSVRLADLMTVPATQATLEGIWREVREGQERAFEASKAIMGAFTTPT